MRVRPSRLVRVAVASAALASVLAGCASVFGLDEVTLVDGDGGTDASTTTDATVLEGGAPTQEAGADAADAAGQDSATDAGADAGTDAAGLCPLPFPGATDMLVDASCVESLDMTDDPSALVRYESAGDAVLFAVGGADGGFHTAGVAFTFTPPRTNLGQTLGFVCVMSAELSSNTQFATDQAQAMVAEVLDPASGDDAAAYAGDNSSSYRQVWVLGSTAGTTPNGTDLLDSGLGAFFTLTLSAIQDMEGQGIRLSTTITPEGGAPSPTVVSSIPAFPRLFLGMSATSPSSYFIKNLQCTAP